MHVGLDDGMEPKASALFSGIRSDGVGTLLQHVVNDHGPELQSGIRFGGGGGRKCE